MCNNNRSTVCRFNFSACFSNEIQTDDARKAVFIGTILHCTYSFWGLCPQTLTGALPLDLTGGLPSPRPPALPLYPQPLHSRYRPGHALRQERPQQHGLLHEWPTQVTITEEKDLGSSYHHVVATTQLHRTGSRSKSMCEEYQ